MIKVSILSLICVLPAVASEVILDYEASASTIVREPFGMTVPRLTKVTGQFVYETDGAEDGLASDQRGEYLLPGTGAFAASFLGRKITGSTRPTLTVNDIQITDGSIDTFRFNDGKDDGNPMLIDGIGDQSIEVSLSINDSDGDAFESDALPTTFPMQLATPVSRYAVTFSLKDSQGTLLLKLISLKQRLPPFRITELRLTDAGPFIDFHSTPGNTYQIEFSTNFINWTVLEPAFPNDGYRTGYSDHGMTQRLGVIPTQGFYRVSKNSE